mgnify:FL=1
MILEERVAQEGRKFYEIFSVRFSGAAQHKADLVTAEGGRHLFRSEDEISMRYLEHRIQKTQTVIQALANAKDAEATELQSFEARLRLLMEVKACLSTQKKS